MIKLGLEAHPHSDYDAVLKCKTKAFTNPIHLFIDHADYPSKLEKPDGLAEKYLYMYHTDA